MEMSVAKSKYYQLMNYQHQQDSYAKLSLSFIGLRLVCKSWMELNELQSDCKSLQFASVKYQKTRVKKMFNASVCVREREPSMNLP